MSCRGPIGLLVALVFCSAAPAFAADAIGKIGEVNGAATIQRGADSIAALAGMLLFVHDRLTTEAGVQVSVLMQDSATLTLGESSTMVIDQEMAGNARAGRISLLVGRLRAIVNAAAAGAASTFEVHTPNAIAGVRGTDFQTDYIEGTPCPGFPACLRYTEVQVFKGAVEVSNPTNAAAPAVLVKEGYDTTVPCELPPSSPGPLGMGELGAHPGYR